MTQHFFNTLNGKENSVSILLYGDIGEGLQVDSKAVVEELITRAARYPKIDVRINSCGGDVFSGMAIFNALKTSKADITVYIDGVAASIAAIVALCGKPLYMAPYAKLMLHSVKAGGYGDAKQLEQTIQLIKQLHGDLSNMVAERLNITPEEVEQRFFDGTDHWFTAQEALQMKLINGIYETDATESPKVGEDVYQYFNNRLSGIQSSNQSFFTYFAELKEKAGRWDAYLRTNSIFENKIKELEVLGELKPSEKMMLQNASKGNPIEFNRLVEAKRAELRNEAQMTFEKLTHSRALWRYFATDRDAIKEFALSQPRLFKKIFETFRQPAAEVWEGDIRANWTLEDYRKYDPLTLQRNPDLVLRLSGKQ
ncbi:ATP-dependent Clp endopeptidase, proteolytic subunit ClpP [Prevotella sp. MSX73]|nr:ATP-dependent Clp endopeptidase, proteolytic subunit ClpP [Prevotella sp. MSX73]